MKLACFGGLVIPDCCVLVLQHPLGLSTDALPDLAIQILDVI